MTARAATIEAARLQARAGAACTGRARRGQRPTLQDARHAARMARRARRIEAAAARLATTTTEAVR